MTRDPAPTLLGAAPAVVTTSGDIAALLRARYCSPEWASFGEFANGTGFGRDRSADFVAFNTYPSKGHLTVACEIKVSRSDFARELTSPAKRAWLEEYFAECWFVAPKGVIRIEELPARWGLMEPRGEGLRAVRRASQDASKCLKDAVMVSLVRRFAELERQRSDDQSRWGEFLGRRLGTDDLLRLAEKHCNRVDRRSQVELARRKEEDATRAARRRTLELREATLSRALAKVLGWGATTEQMVDWVQTHGAAHNAAAIAAQLRAAADLLSPPTAPAVQGNNADGELRDLVNTLRGGEHS